jgi:predicted N-acetyltransferase YhbS
VIELVPLERIAAERVEALLDAAFGLDRHARTAYRMREGTAAIDALSLAAQEGDALLGSIQCWPVRLEGSRRTDSLVLVGPVAVSPEAQRMGIGKMLMAEMLELASEAGFDALLMIGDPEYYGRFFGFSADATAEWMIPGPVERRRLLALITRPGGVAATGRIVPDTNPA